MNYFEMISEDRVFEGYNITKHGNETIYMLAEKLSCSADDAINIILEYAGIHWDDLVKEVDGEIK